MSPPWIMRLRCGHARDAGPTNELDRDPIMGHDSARTSAGEAELDRNGEDSEPTEQQQRDGVRRRLEAEES